MFSSIFQINIKQEMLGGPTVMFFYRVDEPGQPVNSGLEHVPDHKLSTHKPQFIVEEWVTKYLCSQTT